MSQVGYTPIVLYASGTATNTPTAGNLASGELAINYADGKLFYKDSGGTVQVLATKGGVGTSSTTQVLYNSSGLVTGSSTFTYDGAGVLTLNSSGEGRYIGGSTTGRNIFSNSDVTDYIVAYGSSHATYANTLFFVTNSTNNMVMNSSGNVGIGTSSPSYKLDVSLPASTSGTVARFNAPSYEGVYILAGFNNGIGTQSTSNFGIYTNSTARLSVNNSTGNIQFLTSNAGIVFNNSSALTNSTLNDYEVGTWTPNITAGSGSLTAYTSGGYYVKVGRLVTVTGYFQITTAGTASGAAVYSNLPFNLSGTSSNAGQLAFLVRESQATGIIYSGYAQGGSAGGALNNLTGGGAITWTNTYTYPFAFSYYASF
jgi:hypothetical protein